MKPELQKRVKKIKIYKAISRALLLIASIILVANLVIDVGVGLILGKIHFTVFEQTPLSAITMSIIYVSLITDIVGSSMSSSLFIEMVDEDIGEQT